MTRRSLGIWGLAAFAVLCLAGCFNPFRPRIGTGIAIAEPAPRPSSPQGVLQLLRWCWVNRSIAEYEELFTEDFEFAFTDVEAVDNPPILRDEEVAIARRLFVDGNANEPRAKRIDMDFSSSLIPIPDQRPGKIDPWHKEITTRVVLRAELADGIWDVTGDVTFYLVRGDSARIPQQLKDRGFGPSPSRWYIERWEDKTSGASVVAGTPASPTRARTVTPGAAAALPLGATANDEPVYHVTLGDLKRHFR